MICTKKRMDLVLAKLVVAQSRIWKNRPKDECRFYFCDDCHAYHVTSEPDWNAGDDDGPHWQENIP